MGYQETTGTTSRKTNLDFATDKTVKQGNPRLGGVWEYKPMGDMQGRNKEGRG